MGGADEAPQESGSMPEALQLQAPATSNQLTLSFQGDVYVFDSVQPEMVRNRFFLSLLVFSLLVLDFRSFTFS